MDRNRRYTYITIGISPFILFLLGFVFLGPLPIYATAPALKHSHPMFFFYAPSDIRQLRFSMGVLLALCSPMALLLSWSYSRKHSSPITLTTFFVFSLAAIASSVLGLCLRLLKLSSAFCQDYPIFSFSDIDYFR